MYLRQGECYSTVCIEKKMTDLVEAIYHGIGESLYAQKFFSCHKGVLQQEGIGMTFFPTTSCPSFHGKQKRESTTR